SGAPHVRERRPSRDRARASALRPDRAGRSPARRTARDDAARAGCAPPYRRRGGRARERRGRSVSVVRGIRGAITVERDEPELILDATGRLLREIVERNGVAAEDVASALFTVTPDL